MADTRHPTLTSAARPTAACWKQHAAAAAFLAAATIVMTWPLARDIRTAVPDHDDAYFGIWRMAWVAHQLPRAPLRLFDANIFVPAPNTLALSDAALLQGLVAAPPIWLGVRPVVVYDVLLLASLGLSAWCACLLAVRVTRRWGPSLLAGVVFGFGPFRLAQLGHLEMQSAMWMPLALLAVHRLAIAPPGTRDGERVKTARGIGAGVALGVVLAMQALSGLYFFMFLSIVLAAMVGVLLVAIPRGAKWGLARGLVAAALVAGTVLVPYSRPYSRARAVVGPRGAGEVALFSARPGDYLIGSAALSRVADADEYQGAREEHVLSPGLLAPALALVAIWTPLDAWRVASSVALAVAFDASLGTNGHLFPVAQRFVPALDGLRVPARFAVLVLLLLAMLAAIGLARLLQGRSRVTSQLVSAAAIALCAIDFWAAPIALRHPVTRHTDLTRFLARLPAGTVVLHLPVPRTSELWFHETKYQYLSTFHWQPLVNGYSGFPPPVYLRTLDVLRGFPDRESIARLRRLGVGYVVLHPDLFVESEYARIASAVEQSGDFEFVARFSRQPIASAVFRLKPEQAATGP